jgi:hypothetical protein
LTGGLPASHYTLLHPPTAASFWAIDPEKPTRKYTPPPPSTHFFDLLTKEYGITVDIRERWQDLQYPMHGWPHYNPDDRRVGLGAGRDELEVVEPEPELGGEEGAKEKQST